MRCDPDGGLSSSVHGSLPTRELGRIKVRALRAKRSKAPSSFSTTQTKLQGHCTTDKMANRNPFEEYANRIREAAKAGGRGGFPRGGGFPGGRPPRGLGSGIAGLVLLGGGALLFQSALFNVDGGHRAIKYQRINGVSKDIYGEGAAHVASVKAIWY